VCHYFCGEWFRSHIMHQNKMAKKKESKGTSKNRNTGKCVFEMPEKKKKVIILGCRSVLLCERSLHRQRDQMCVYTWHMRAFLRALG
jgi:hypothetical protein